MKIIQIIKDLLEKNIWHNFRKVRKKVLRKLLGRELFEGLLYNASLGSMSLVKKSDVILETASKINYWKYEFDKITPKDIFDMQKYQELNFKLFPKFSIVVCVYKTNIKFLQELLNSLENQVYENYEICIVDDFSCDNLIKETLLSFQKRLNNINPNKVKLKFLEKNLGISLASNEALNLADGDYVVLVDHDDIIPWQTLWTLAYYINKNNGEVDLLYSDEDKLDEKGSRRDPYFKSDFSHTLLLYQNYIAHLGVYKREIINKIGGFREGFDGSQDYDLVLKFIKETNRKRIIHIPYILYHWRKYESYNSFSNKNENKSLKSALKALNNFVSLDNKIIIKDDSSDNYIINYTNSFLEPLVSIIICFKDKIIFLKNVLDMIYYKTKYKNIEVILVDNGSKEDETFIYLEYLKNTFSNIKIIMDDREFNYSRLNNLGATKSSSEYLLFLNNDIGFTGDELWLYKMMRLITEEKDIGALGVKLLYPDKKIQCAGVVIGMGHAATNFFAGREDNIGYFRWDSCPRDVSAITGACFLVRKEIFDKVKGFDEELFPINFNDVDLSLKILDSGYRNCLMNNIKLFHYENVSRKDDGDQSKEYFQSIKNLFKKYGNRLYHDNFFNPNLALTINTPTVSEFPRSCKLWRDFVEVICPFDLGDILITLSVSITIAKKYNKKIRFWTDIKMKEFLSDININTPNLEVSFLEIYEKRNHATTLSVLEKCISFVMRRPDSSQNIKILHSGILETDHPGVHLLEDFIYKFDIKYKNDKILNLDIKEKFLKCDFDLKKTVFIHIKGGWDLKSIGDDILYKINHICENRGLNLVQIGSKKDKKILDKNILENLSIGEWSYLLKRAKLFIGIDSFFSHLSSIINCNGVVFYGSTRGSFLNIKKYLENQEGKILIFETICKRSPCNSYECFLDNSKNCKGYCFDELKFVKFLDSLDE